MNEKLHSPVNDQELSEVSGGGKVIASGSATVIGFAGSGETEAIQIDGTRGTFHYGECSSKGCPPKVILDRP